MYFFRYIFIFFIISCGGGSGGSSVNEMEFYPSIKAFDSSSSSITVNESILLSWQSINTSSCSASGDWNGDKSSSGSESLNLTQTKTYSFVLTCYGQNNLSLIHI